MMMTGTSKLEIGIEAVYSQKLPNQKEDHEIHRFIYQIPLKEVPPLKEGSEPSEEPPPYQQGSSHYSGRHDSGLLPPLREGGPYKVLLQGIQKAKADSDNFLTQIIRDSTGLEEMEADEWEKEEDSNSDDDEGNRVDDGFAKLGGKAKEVNKTFCSKKHKKL